MIDYSFDMNVVNNAICSKIELTNALNLIVDPMRARERPRRIDGAFFDAYAVTERMIRLMQ